MEMDIDIHKMDSMQILTVMQTYPNGHLKIKQERVFWSALVMDRPVSNIPNNPQPAPMQNGVGQGNQMQGMANRFEKAANVLGSMVCAPR